jgi:hypothetical protein
MFTALLISLLLFTPGGTSTGVQPLDNGGGPPGKLCVTACPAPPVIAPLDNGGGPPGK